MSTEGTPQERNITVGVYDRSQAEEQSASAQSAPSPDNNTATPQAATQADAATVTQDSPAQTTQQGTGGDEYSFKPDLGEQQQPTEAAPAFDPYKELGLNNDPATQKYIEAVKAGKVREYLEKATVDYTQMDDKDMLRLSLKQENPDFNPNEIETLLNRKLRSYGFGEGEDAEKEGNLALKADMRKVREALVREQSEYQLPTAPQQHPNPEQARQQQEYQQLQSYFDTHPGLNAFETNRRVQFGTGDSAFNYELPEGINPKDAAKDASKLFAHVWEVGKDGNPVLNATKYAKLLAYAADMDGIEAKMQKHFMQLGQSGFVQNELRNAGVGEPTSVPQPTRQISVGMQGGDR